MRVWGAGVLEGSEGSWGFWAGNAGLVMCVWREDGDGGGAALYRTHDALAPHYTPSPRSLSVSSSARPTHTPYSPFPHSYITPFSSPPLLLLYSPPLHATSPRLLHTSSTHPLSLSLSLSSICACTWGYLAHGHALFRWVLGISRTLFLVVDSLSQMFLDQAINCPDDTGTDGKFIGILVCRQEVKRYNRMELQIWQAREFLAIALNIWAILIAVYVCIANGCCSNRYLYLVEKVRRGDRGTRGGTETGVDALCCMCVCVYVCVD